MNCHGSWEAIVAPGGTFGRFWVRNKPCRPFRGGFGARPGLWVPGDGPERVARPYWPPWCCCRPPCGGRGGCPFWAPGVGAGMAHPRRWALWGVPWPVGRFSGPVGGPPAALAAFLYFYPPDLVIIHRFAGQQPQTMASVASRVPLYRDPGGEVTQSAPRGCRHAPPPYGRPALRCHELPLRRTSEPARGEQRPAAR